MDLLETLEEWADAIASGDPDRQMREELEEPTLRAAIARIKKLEAGKKDYKRWLANRPECKCNGWGCWGCCTSEAEIRGKQGTFG